MQGVNKTTEQIFDGIHVVHDAIVGALGDGENARFGLFVFDERIGFNLLANIFGLEFFSGIGPMMPR